MDALYAWDAKNNHWDYDIERKFRSGWPYYTTVLKRKQVNEKLGGLLVWIK